ncbi:MAG: class I SAM-dependent methyltransferase [Deltaproteobacteria bacterium]|nr:class I SAM-dependent methyltransferase [Deltaproteobacteria bacterium]
MADQSIGLLSPWLRTQRIKKISPYLRGKILDYGCGIGSLVEICAPNYYIGVDIDGPSINIARMKYPRFRFETIIPEGEHFDSIVLLAVIEHIKNPVDILRRMSVMLNPDGWIVITTPHPMADIIHYLGARMGLFSALANEQHEKLIDLSHMNGIASQADVSVSKYERFLLGTNQLFILKPVGKIAPSK